MPERFERDFLKRLEGSRVGEEEIRRLLSNREARKFHAVRRALAAHPRSPRAEALALIPTLFWRDLAWISTETRSHPEIRRAADQELLKRLPGMALAEKIDLAAIAGRGVIAALRREREIGIVRALLRNRLLTEADVVTMAAFTESAEGLSVIAADESWGCRQAVRTAVARNRRAPLNLALVLVGTLPLQELRELLSEAWRPLSLREAAREEIRLRLEGCPRVD
jgi:hypothetical protein